MSTRSVLEVVAPVSFHYSKDPKVTYEIPAGLALAADEAWCIYGISGSGKSTLMTLLAALRRFRQGRIRYAFPAEPAVEVSPEGWEDRVGPELWRRIGFAFQRPELIRALTVADNLALVAGRASTNGSPLFTSHEWGEIARSRVGRISGGQIQRLGLICAFGPGQSLVFLDEPTNNLDRRNRQAVADLVRDRRKGRALVVVSHDDDFIRTLDIDRVFEVAERRQGDGAVRRVLTPADPAAAGRMPNAAVTPSRRVLHLPQALESKLTEGGLARWRSGRLVIDGS